MLAPFMFPRIIIAWSGFALCSFILSMLSCFNKRGAPYSGTKADIIRFVTKYAAKNVINMLTGGSIEVEERKVDYKKWLGPDWKCSFKNATAVVANH